MSLSCVWFLDLGLGGFNIFWDLRFCLVWGFSVLGLGGFSIFGVWGFFVLGLGGLMFFRWRRGSIPRRSWRSGEPSV